MHSSSTSLCRTSAGHGHSGGATWPASSRTPAGAILGATEQVGISFDGARNDNTACFRLAALSRTSFLRRRRWINPKRTLRARCWMKSAQILQTPDWTPRHRPARRVAPREICGATGERSVLFYSRSRLTRTVEQNHVLCSKLGAASRVFTAHACVDG